MGSSGKNYFLSFWRGEEQLWKAFWVVGFAITAVLWVTSHFAAEKNLPIIWWQVFYVVALVVQIWWMVSVWRCAKNSSKHFWFILGRTAVVLSGLNTIKDAVLLFR